MAQIDAAVDPLLVQRLVGHPTDVPEVRVLFVGRCPYKVFYRVRGDDLEILHIRRTSRRVAKGF